MQAGSESYFRSIESNRAATKVDPQDVSIRVKQSSLAIRLRGCFITQCSLIDPSTNTPIDILYAESDHTVPKLMASHPMSPAGPFEGPGGQHGFPRWADYNVTEQQDTSGKLTLETHREDGQLMLQKSFELSEHSLLSRTTIYNPDADPHRSSLGEHYYYPLPHEDTAGLTINGQAIDVLLGRGILDQIMSGEAAFWEDFPGYAEMHFPAGYTLRLEASAKPDVQLGMLLWHKPGSQTICFEPTAGYLHHVMNSGICMEKGEQATLTSSLTLI